jgi:hypothetical protein
MWPRTSSWYSKRSSQYGQVWGTSFTLPWSGAAEATTRDLGPNRSGQDVVFFVPPAGQPVPVSFVTVAGGRHQVRDRPQRRTRNSSGHATPRRGVDGQTPSAGRRRGVVACWLVVRTARGDAVGPTVAADDRAP